MASYHRVLNIFGRSIKEKFVECNYDIHPWDLLVDGERWAGKIRLIGYVDAFILVCYSGESRFEHGLIIYKDDEAIREALKSADIQDPKAIGLNAINSEQVQADKEKANYYSCSEEASLFYKITSLGHPIGLTMKYLVSGLKKHEIKLSIGGNTVMRSRIRRGVTQHSLLGLLLDALRLGLLTQAQVIEIMVTETVGGSIAHTTGVKYLNTLIGNTSENVTLAAEQR